MARIIAFDVSVARDCVLAYMVYWINEVQAMTLEESFNDWWESEGKQLSPVNNSWRIDRVRALCKIAWSNGAYMRGREIQKLIKDS